MIEIKDIEFYQETNRQLFYSGQTTTKKELIRPFIKFKNSKGEVVECWNSDNKFRFFKNLSVNQRASLKSFNKEELMLLSRLFKFDVEQYKSHEDILDGYIKSDKPKFKSPGEFFYIEQNGVSYIIIFFRRWQFDNQPRSAGEDAMGEDVTYIHGIWENPDLPPEIIKKIKS